MAEIKHESIHAERCEHPSSALEKAYAERWKHYNTQSHYLDLLLRDNRHAVTPFAYGPLGDPRPYFFGEPPTQRDAHVAATIIQWLGSNVGRAFVEEVLDAQGFVIARRKTANG